MLFKRGFKKIFEDFKQRKNLKGKKKEKIAEEKFYEKYFKTELEKIGVSITFSHQPRKSSSEAIPLFNPTTINSNYVEAVMSCKTFKAEFLNYVDNRFVKDYCRSREAKISRVLEKCLQLLIEHPNKGPEMVVDYIMKNKKCKLPWSNRELNQAIESVKYVSADK